MLIYQTVIYSEVGDGETGPMVEEDWVDQKGRSAKDATKRIRRILKAEGVRNSYLKRIKFSESDKLTGEALKEFLQYEAELPNF